MKTTLWVLIVSGTLFGSVAITAHSGVAFRFNFDKEGLQIEVLPEFKNPSEQPKPVLSPKKALPLQSTRDAAS